MLGQESDGTANLRIVLFHFADTFGEAFDIAIGKANPAKPNAMSGKMLRKRGLVFQARVELRERQTGCR